MTHQTTVRLNGTLPLLPSTAPDPRTDFVEPCLRYHLHNTSVCYNDFTSELLLITPDGKEHTLYTQTSTTGPASATAQIEPFADMPVNQLISLDSFDLITDTPLYLNMVANGTFIDTQGHRTTTPLFSILLSVAQDSCPHPLVASSASLCLTNPDGIPTTIYGFNC